MSLQVTLGNWNRLEKKWASKHFEFNYKTLDLTIRLKL